MYHGLPYDPKYKNILKGLEVDATSGKNVRETPHIHQYPF